LYIHIVYTYAHMYITQRKKQARKKIGELASWLSLLALITDVV